MDAPSFATVKSTTLEGNSYQDWINLANSPDDFSIVMNKETLTGLISCLQTNMNNVSKEVFMSHLIERQKMICDAFKQKNQEVTRQIAAIDQQLNEEERKFVLMKKEFYKYNMKEEMLDEQITKTRRLIQEHQTAVHDNTFDNDEKVAYCQSVVNELREEVVKKGNDLKDVNERKGILEENYRKLEDAFQKYRAAYDKVRKEVDNLNAQLK